MNVLRKAAADKAGAADLCSRLVVGDLRTPDGSREAVSWYLPDEKAVALQINSASYTVMMATPSDLRDFATGFLLSEGLIKSAKDIAGVLIMPVDGGVAIDVAIEEGALDPSRLVRRAMEGRTGCGLCGVEDIAAAIRPLPVVARDWAPEVDAIRAAAAALQGEQPMNRLNHSVHGAAWVSREGRILLVREDVGRHNALDKLIGALASAEIDPASGFVLMTSRCSFELVQKIATAGIGAMVTVSAPTAFALDLALQSNLFLASLGPGGVVIFNP